jgi:hypothetical protein
MQPSHPKTLVQEERPEKTRREADMVAISQILLRMVAHLEKVEYTALHKERQAEVLEHDDPPDPASDTDISQG